MVGSDNDEGLVGMLGVEFEYCIYSPGEIIGLVEGGDTVVCVGCIVDLATLNHKEEALILEIAIKIIYSGAGEVKKFGSSFLAVDGILEIRLVRV